MQTLEEIVNQCNVNTYQEGETYYLLSKKWLNLAQNQVQLKSMDINQHLQSINYDLCCSDKTNAIKFFPGYEDASLNAIPLEKLKLDKDCVCISEALWLKLIVSMLSIKAYFKDYQCFKCKIEQGQIIQQYICVRFVPFYEGIQNPIEGYQQFPLIWNEKETIMQLEKAFQNQLLFQVPKNNFIKLYTLKNEPLNFLEFYKHFQEKQLEVVEFVGDLKQLKQSQYLIVDIKLLNKDFYFEKDVQRFDDSAISPQSNDSSVQGYSLFENQTSLTSCILKCYECIEKLRTKVLNTPNTKIQSIIQESWFGTSDIVLYDSLDFELFHETQITIQPNRYDFIYVNGSPQKLQLSNNKTLKEIIQTLLPDQESLFECSNLNYTEQINLDMPSNQLKEGYNYYLSGYIHEENQIEIIVQSCILQDSGLLKTYKNFKPIRKCYVNREQKYFDLHMKIANLFQETSISDYKEHIVNKIYELIFQTDQTAEQSCTFCEQKLCNNCIVPFIDKRINIKSSKVFIYAIYKEAELIQREQPIEVDQYNLEDYFDFSKQNEEFLILNIDQTLIHPKKISFPDEINNYKLNGVIEEIGLNQYQCYCFLKGEWIKFNDEGFQKANYGINVIKLIYCKFK